MRDSPNIYLLYFYFTVFIGKNFKLAIDLTTLMLYIIYIKEERRPDPFWQGVFTALKIVVLDGYTLNPGDLSWGKLSALCKTEIYDRTPAGLIVERAQGAEIVLTNKCVFTKEVFDNLPLLKYVGVLATGYNNIDVMYAKEKGVTVTNIPAYSTESVVQTTFGLMIECYSRLYEHSAAVKAGKWVTCPDFSFYGKNYREMFGKTLGIIGFGRIGKRVADVALAFGLKVQVYDKGRTHTVNSVTFVKTLEELYAAADIISLHCPLNKDNIKMIDARAISYMKKEAVLINTARGGLIDEAALAEALNTGRISAAGLDVLSSEPPKEDNPLLTAKNALITPHIGWATAEARMRLMDIAAGNVESYLAGNPINKVN